MQTYEGILKDDRIEWVGETPSRDRPVRVQVTVVDSEQGTDRGSRMADALDRLAESDPFNGIDDPVEWQRRVRTDRSLPGRGVEDE